MAQLKHYSAVRAALLPVLRRLPRSAVKSPSTSMAIRAKRQRNTQNQKPCTPVRRQVRDCRTFSNKARMLTFRTLTAQKAVSLKNTVQASRAAALAVRGEQTRLLEGRYYRTRAKLRLPNQRVRRAERKREGLRLFARHTLKRPETAAGRGKLLLPAQNTYVATP